MKPGGQRRKGHNMERWVVREYKKFCPYDVVRGQQAHSPDLPDAWMPGVWSECQDAKDVTPVKKLEQAERDIQRHHPDFPLNLWIYGAIIHRKGTRWDKTEVWVRWGTLLKLWNMGMPPGLHMPHFNTDDLSMPVQIPFSNWCTMLKRAKPWEEKPRDPPTWKFFKAGHCRPRKE